MNEHSPVEVIARGVCVVDGHILLCHGKRSALTYLPGGHIEFGETARTAWRSRPSSASRPTSGARCRSERWPGRVPTPTARHTGRFATVLASGALGPFVPVGKDSGLGQTAERPLPARKPLCARVRAMSLNTLTLLCRNARNSP